MDEEISKEEEYLNNWKRALADLSNYKKDETKRLENLVKFANQTVILDVVDIVSNLELAAEHIDDPGLKNILKQFESLLKKYGVERIAVAGQKFDPSVHEAIEPISDEAKIAEARPGYTMHGKVILSAKIKNG